MNTVFYFTAAWCGPCQKVKPIVAKINDEYEEDKKPFKVIDIDDNPELARKYRIQSVPTFVIIKNEQEIGRITGAKPKKDLMDMLTYEQ